MNEQTDSQLLALYAEKRSESAFAELVRRHLDFVYSAAARMVRDPHLAEDVTQAVFVVLAKSSGQLTDRLSLCGWLHRTATNIAAQTVRTIERRRAREHEAAMMSAMPDSQSESPWDQIAPHLDAALGELNEADRDAVFLRYFRNYDFRTLGQALEISDDAAQKRVSRAMDQIRALLAKRGVVIGASGLVVCITTHGVQSAPSGLAAAVSAAGAIAEPAGFASNAIATTKAIAMTTFQKAIYTVALAVAAGAGIYEARRAHHWRLQTAALERQQTSLAEQIQRLQDASVEGSNRLAGLLGEISTLKSNQSQKELLRLRGQVGQMKTAEVQKDSDPAQSEVKSLMEKARRLRQYLDQHPVQEIPEVQLVSEVQWFDAVKANKLESEADFNEALHALRISAKQRFGNLVLQGLQEYAAANDGNLPDSLTDLQPYFGVPVDDSILQRYGMLRTGKVSDVPPDASVIQETAPLVNPGNDSQFEFKMNGFTIKTIRAQ